MLEEKWKREDQAPDIPPFTSASQIKVDLTEDTTPLTFVELFLDDKFYEHLTFQTNLYAAQYITVHDIFACYSRARCWKEVTVDEMKQFLVLYLLTGIIRKPEVGQYWSISSVIKTPYFNDVMSQNRFQSILQFFHFNDNSQYDINNPNQDKLFKIRPIITYLVTKFKTVYFPDREVSTDEELLLWKGRLSFKQYIPSKQDSELKYFHYVRSMGIYRTPLFI